MPGKKGGLDISYLCMATKEGVQFHFLCGNRDPVHSFSWYSKTSKAYTLYCFIFSETTCELKLPHPYPHHPSPTKSTPSRLLPPVFHHKTSPTSPKVKPPRPKRWGIFCIRAPDICSYISTLSSLRWVSSPSRETSAPSPPPCLIRTVTG